MRRQKILVYAYTTCHIACVNTEDHVCFCELCVPVFCEDGIESGHVVLNDPNVTEQADAVCAELRG